MLRYYLGVYHRIHQKLSLGLCVATTRGIFRLGAWLSHLPMSPLQNSSSEWIRTLWHVLICFVTRGDRHQHLLILGERCLFETGAPIPTQPAVRASLHLCSAPMSSPSVAPSSHASMALRSLALVIGSSRVPQSICTLRWSLKLVLNLDLYSTFQWPFSILAEHIKHSALELGALSTA